MNIAHTLFPNTTATIADLEVRFPLRNLPQDAMVTRYAPSPTGFLHFGALYSATLNTLLAKQSNGVVSLRIEDTDALRTIENGEQILLDALRNFGIDFDESIENPGSYQPYRQTDRVDIYHTVAKYLVDVGHAYPCFCTPEDLSAMREEQAQQKANPGYYGEWAKCRNLTSAQNDKPYVLRLKSRALTASHKFNDLALGEVNITPNNQDIVLLKSDGIPTYHFAHVCDDHFMRTTHVVRGEEWLASLPIHLELFELLGWQHPQYVHHAAIMKLDGGGKRKLSKRKDPEADMRYFKEQGYPLEAIREYVITLLFSDFEEWRAANHTLPLEDFAVSTDKLSVSGALFDMVKLNDISKNVIAQMTAEQVYEQLYTWAQEYNPAFAALLAKDKAQSLAMLSIGRGGDKPRKDLANWAEVPAYLDFFFDETFQLHDAYPDNIPAELRKQVLQTVAENINLESENFFADMKALAEPLNFAVDNKAYKQNPEQYAGNIADFMSLVRIAVCGRANAPDIFPVLQILGKERAIARLMVNL